MEDLYEEQNKFKNNNQIAYINEENVNFEEFYTNILSQNRPCLVSKVSTRNWMSRRQWVAEDGKPNFDFLEKMFGDEVVPVADCKIKHYDAQLKREMVFSEYLNYWKDYISKNYDQNLDCLYLKDWHFCRSYPEYSAYDILPYFSSDWLNEYWDQRKDVQDDYRFVYMGPKGSWTPFHADVFRSYSWSANICGRKRWILCSPTLSKKLLHKFKTQPYDILPVIQANEETDWMDIVQQPGEIIFVPSNWYHQVYNLDDCISINHNWFNATNANMVWQFLKSSLEEAKKEIADCSDMEGWTQQCQILLKAVQGMDFIEFCNLLMKIGQNRIELLEHKNKSETSTSNVVYKEMEFKNLNFEIRLMLLDLCKIKQLLHELTHFSDWKALDLVDLADDPEKIMEQIEGLVANVDDSSS